MGVLAPNGIGLKAFWDSLLAGKSGIGPITLFDASNFKSRIAGEVKGFDPLDYIEASQKPKRMARQTQLAYAATMMALNDAGFDLAAPDLPSPTPVVVGVSTSAIDVIESVYFAMRDKGPNRAPTTSSASSIPQASANTIADRLGSSAHAATVSSACPSGLDAVEQAASMIRSGEASLAIAGGTDAPITALTMSSFIAAGLCSVRNDEPEKASRPFDLHRDSGVISEGAGMLVLESEDRALARGARVYAEIAGYGRQRDSSASEPGSGLESSMSLALANSQLGANAVDYISAYGPGHPVLDRAEVRVIRKVFGERAQHIPVSSIKGVTGNPLSAGGPFQIIAGGLSIRDQIIPPTTNYETPDPECSLDFVSRHPRRARLEHILINVRGIGGGASSMVLKRARDE